MAGHDPSKDAMVFGLLLVALVVMMILMFFAKKRRDNYIKKNSKGPVTQEPIIPFPQEGLHEFKGNYKIKNIIPEARIQCDSNESNKIGSSTINALMDSLFNLNENAEDEYEWMADTQSSKLKPKISVSDNAQIISIKMNNFKHGKQSHDFEPIDGRSPGSYYTYQMFGENRFQVTNYVENGITYVAGFCIYIKYGTYFPNFSLEEKIKECLLSRKYQIGQSKKNENQELPTQEGTAWNFSPETREALIKGNPRSLAPYNKSIYKLCTRFRKETLSIVKDDKVFHENFHSILKVVVLSECKNCTDELNDDRLPNYSSMFAV